MKEYLQTDLACESYTIDDEKDSKNGIISHFYKDIFSYDIIKTEITNKTGEKITKKSIGKYYTLYVKDAWKYTIDEKENISCAIAFCINEILNDFGITSASYLAVGLGNRNISSDALGPLSIDEMIATHHLKDNKNIYNKFGYDLSLLAPPVLGQSGIDSVDIIKYAVDVTKASCLIVIDSLSTKSLDRLCTTLQITNTGIKPASAIKEGRKEISYKSIGIPVISIGVPCAINLESLVYSFLEGNATSRKLTKKSNNNDALFLTRNEIENIVPAFAKIISNAITKAIKNN